MLHFFRRIRKKLLGEGDLSKYVLYAIGEVLLVMIGILLALQVNNWNEFRKDRREEAKIIQNIAADLRIDTAYLSGRKHIFQQEYAALRSFIQKSYEIQQSADDFRSLFRNINFDVKNLLLQDNTFNEASQNGKMSLIRDETLKKTIEE